MKILAKCVLLAILFLGGCSTDKASVVTEDAILKPLPAECQAKVNISLTAAGENRKELITALVKIEKEQFPAMAFLVGMTGYRYFMPSMAEKICDATTISADLLMSHIKLGYEARQIFPWSKDLEKDIFRRYVLTYRMTTEKLNGPPDQTGQVGWRSYFWHHPELRPIVDEYAKRCKQAESGSAKDQIFREMIYTINTEWVGKNVPYAPRGMPDMNPIEAINAKTGRCTDQTNTLIAILRTFGIAATGVRTVWWPDQNDNHTWTAVYNPFTKEWLDIDSGQGGSAIDPDYFRMFIHHKKKKSAKIYWVSPGEEDGKIHRQLALKGDETYPSSIGKYLILKPMVDMTERYNDVTDLKVLDLSADKAGVPPDTLIWLAVYNSGMWKPVAGARSTTNGKVTFPNVGCNIRYRLMTCKNNSLAYCSEILIPNSDNSVEIHKADPRDNALLLNQRAIQLLESGKLAEAKGILKTIIEIQPDNASVLYNMACACSLMDDKDEALDYLKKSIAAGWDNFTHINKDTDLDNIRNEDRFKKLIEGK